ncbi:lactonase family protein [bacterium]|nr:lactonase family protein [bacterium]
MRNLGLGAATIAFGLGTLNISPSSATEAIAKQGVRELFLYVGTYTYGKSEGIYVHRMDLSSGALKFASVAKGVVNPSFLAFGPRRRHLYAVCEVSRLAGKPGGAVSAFRIDPKTGKLTYLNRQASGGAGPCHLSVHKKGNFVFVAHYAGGSVSVLPIQDDGQLGKVSDVVQHQGSSVNPRRQEGPHPHSVNLGPANRYLFVPDLGLDKIMIYGLDMTHGKLKPNEEPWARVKAGAGPRHFAFHPNGRYAYVINELNSTLTAFGYDEKLGRLRELETVPTLPGDFKGRNTCADVHVSPSGRFLYGSNRGHDSIVIFAIEEGTGKLAYVGHEPTQGKTPRNFAIDPTGTFLLAANQNSGTIVTFRIDRPTGRLSATGHVANVPAPVCLKMIPISP